jgi:hypothetical protein
MRLVWKHRHLAIPHPQHGRVTRIDHRALSGVEVDLEHESGGELIPGEALAQGLVGRLQLLVHVQLVTVGMAQGADAERRDHGGVEAVAQWHR